MKFILPKSEPQGAHFPPCSADSNSNWCVAWLYYKKLCHINSVVFQQAGTRHCVIASAAHGCSDDIFCLIMAAWMLRRKMTLKVS